MMLSAPTTAAAMALPSDQDASGRSLGEEELVLLEQALRSGTLTATKGQFTRRVEARFGELLDQATCVACSSGSAAIHTALAAIDPEPGDEVITTAITDMGALTPILYQGAIPVFADVSPDDGIVTAETIAARLSPRTRAIIVTHLFGRAADMAPILAVAERAGVPVIEDCAQAFLTRYDGQPVGTLGDMGCFSLQQGKHVTTGEGGLVVTRDPSLARRARLFVNKGWGYGDPNPDHSFVALNYRWSELQAAVALAQLEKLEAAVDQRVGMARLLTGLLADVPGLRPPQESAGITHTYWKYPVMVDPEAVPGGAVALAARIKEANIASAPRYIQKPAFACAVIRDQRTFGDSRWPFTLARPEALDYAPSAFPGTHGFLDRVLVLPWNENYREEHVAYLADALRQGVAECRRAGL